jgi:3',5'-cyclic-nucleotide phosphodiesterase
MDLKVLGCHGGETPKHRTSSFLIDDVLGVDAGAITGTLSLEEQRRIRAIVVSHAHMDHVRDLATIADNRCQQGGPPLEIAGTPATLRSLKKHFFNDHLWPDFSRIETKTGPTITYTEIKPEKSAKVAGLTVTPILVSHTIETAGFVIAGKNGAIAYSGDTGPTERLWEVINEREDLTALLMEVSFPNDQAELARVSGHHTPATLKTELEKLRNHDELPILLYHIKPLFHAKVEKQLAKIKRRNLTILQLEDRFLL